MVSKSTFLTVARPYFLRALAAGLLALAGLVVAAQGDMNSDREPEKLLAIAGTGVFVVFGTVAVRAISKGVRRASGEQLGDSRAGPLGLVISVVGYVIVVLSALPRLGVDMSGILLGGALTGVVVGIAAQQTLGNFFAGLVLLLVRPFVLGDHVVLRSSPLGGEYEGLVTDMGLFYVSLDTAQGPVALPNAGVLASAVGPGARAPKDTPDEEEPPDDQGPLHGGTAP